MAIFDHVNIHDSSDYKIKALYNDIVDSYLERSIRELKLNQILEELRRYGHEFYYKESDDYEKYNKFVYEQLGLNKDNVLYVYELHMKILDNLLYSIRIFKNSEGYNILKKLIDDIIADNEHYKEEFIKIGDDN